MAPLLIGMVLALAALAFVLFPIFTGTARTGAPAGTRRERPEAEAEPHDPVEALIRRHRELSVSCPVCGERSEPEAAYCSRCGSRLGDGRPRDAGT
jgi:hypothetical protein